MAINILSFIKGTELIFDDDFNQSLDKVTSVTFSQSLTNLIFGWDFNQSLANVISMIFPQSLTSITFGFYFKN